MFRRATPCYPFTLPSFVFRRVTPCFVMQRKGRRECDAERGSVRMKRRKEREERDDEGMWSGKLQRWKWRAPQREIVVTKTLAPRTEHTRPENRQWLQRNTVTMQRRNNNKNQNEPHTHIWGSTATSCSQNCGRTTCLQGKSTLLWENTVKRRKEKNDGEKRETTVSPGGQE